MKFDYKFIDEPQNLKQKLNFYNILTNKYFVLGNYKMNMISTTYH